MDKAGAASAAGEVSVTSAASHPADHPQTCGRPGTGVTAIGVLVALCCIGFAVVNLVFESTGHFTHGPWAGDVSGLAEAPGACLSGRRDRLGVGRFRDARSVLPGHRRRSDRHGLGPDRHRQPDRLAGVSYMLFFLQLAAGYSVLAISYSRRQRLRKRFAVLGVLGAPVVLGLVLLAAPKLLTAAGLLPPP